MAANIKSVVYTVGHSTMPIYDFVNLLKKNEINCIVDVRTKPFSSYNPQFNRFTLKDSLTQNGIDYRWMGSHLGGLGVNTNFDESIKWVAELGQRMKVAVMCSEGDYHKCHRHELLEPAFKNIGCTVLHIKPDGMLETSTPDKDKKQKGIGILNTKQLFLF